MWFKKKRVKENNLYNKLGDQLDNELKKKGQKVNVTKEIKKALLYNDRTIKAITKLKTIKEIEMVSFDVCLKIILPLVITMGKKPVMDKLDKLINIHSMLVQGKHLRDEQELNRAVKEIMKVARDEPKEKFESPSYIG